MEGKEAIIKRIIDDATSKADNIGKEAKKTVDENIDSANEWVKEYTETQKRIIEAEAIEMVERRKTVGELDSRKIMLGAKQTVMKKVFDSALEKMCNIEKSKYYKIVENLLEKYAEKGDKLVLAKNSKISKDDVIKMPSFEKMKLEYLSSDGDFQGGIKLINDICDKDLSFGSILESKKQELESKVAEMLFN